MVPTQAIWTRSPAADFFRSTAEAVGHAIPDIIIEGEVIESDPPRKPVHTFPMLMDPTTAAEKATRVTYEITEVPGGSCALTLTHELEGAPQLAAIIGGSLEEFGAGGGHPRVLSDLKSLLETGSGLAG